MNSFASDLTAFYESVGYGLAVLVMPLILWTAFLTICLATIAHRLKPRVGLPLAMVFVTSFSMVGSVSGTIAGATLESIVGAVLAAILGLVSSLLAYLFGKENLRAWRPVIPLAIIALLSSTLIGLVIGGSRRTQSLREQDTAAHVRFEFENADVPALREVRTSLARRCVAEKKYDEAVKDCDSE